MATNWITLSGADIRKVINAVSQQDTNENTADTVQPGDELVMTEANRRDECVATVVTMIRAAIRTGSRYPYAVTPDTIPPEGERFALVIAAYDLIQSTPGLVKSFLIGDNGAKTSFERRYEEAYEWIYGKLEGGIRKGGLAGGAQFTPPTDPVGEDWTTAVSSTNPAISAIKWGDQDGNQDDYAAGEHTDADGNTTTLPIDMTT